MSHFYKKYKNLFLAEPQQKLTQQSYIKPYKNEMISRANSLNKNQNPSYHHPRHHTQAQSQNQLNYKSMPHNRFQAEILPQFDKLNRRNERLIGMSQAKYPIFYTPESNKYKKGETLKAINIAPVFSPQITKKFRQRFHELSHIRPKQHHSTLNPEHTIQLKIDPPAPYSQKNLKTEPAPQPNIFRYLPRIDHSRDGYNYPQINHGLIFSEYEQQNQYKLVNSRIKDLRWIEKYYPRGNINMYKEALLRRKDYKGKIDERRNRVRKLFMEERKQYDRKRSIV